jgi:hypothetical protein
LERLRSSSPLSQNVSVELSCSEEIIACRLVTLMSAPRVRSTRTLTVGAGLGLLLLCSSEDLTFCPLPFFFLGEAVREAEAADGADLG